MVQTYTFPYLPDEFVKKADYDALLAHVERLEDAGNTLCIYIEGHCIAEDDWRRVTGEKPE